MASLAEARNKHVPLSLVTALVTVVMWGVHIGLREMGAFEPGDPVRVLATAALVTAFAAHVVVTVRMMRLLDEFQKDIQFAALAMAFPLSVVVMLAVGFFRAEGMLVNGDPRDLPVPMLLAYAVGLARAWWRYRS
jgi:uncharacterized sodium:solute symporter family permease YidK